MATTDVSAVQTSSLLASLYDFQNRFNNDQRVKKLIKSRAGLSRRRGR